MGRIDGELTCMDIKRRSLFSPYGLKKKSVFFCVIYIDLSFDLSIIQADMFNFAPHRSQFDENYSFETRGELFAKTHVRTADKRMQIYSDRDASARSELFETYGDNANDIYFHYHAFVPIVNPSACVNVRMDLFDKPCENNDSVA